MYLPENTFPDPPDTRLHGRTRIFGVNNSIDADYDPPNMWAVQRFSTCQTADSPTPELPFSEYPTSR